ncbi:MAG: VWA domain-containing protein [Hyphomicrobiaceae bacterium]|nr:VWA domain-containing protein [Hyphomicrobiaceae bacterium]
MQTGLQIARLRGGFAAMYALAGLGAWFSATSPASAQQYAPPDGIGTAAREPEPANTDFETSCTNDAMIVMDASGSMAHLSKGGGSRIEVARSVAREIVPISAKTRSLGLMTFGPGTSDQCSNVTLKVPVQSNAASRILTEIDAITTDGGTPLSLAVETAAEALDYRHRDAVIVVLSDGDETCGRDPCAAARALKARAHDLTIHVVSLEGEPSEATTASCMANETNGLFIPTRSQQDLEDALSRTLLCPRVASLASDAAYVMSGQTH